MNLRRWVAALFAILAIAGCAQVTTGQGAVPSYPHDDGLDMRGS